MFEKLFIIIIDRVLEMLLCNFCPLITSKDKKKKFTSKDFISQKRLNTTVTKTCDMKKTFKKKQTYEYLKRPHREVLFGPNISPIKENLEALYTFQHP